MNQEKAIKERVKAQYSKTASRDDASTVAQEPLDDAIRYAESIGYSSEELRSVPKGAAVTHGCGNPMAIAEIQDGATVLDLGCGGGLDAFLAAHRVGRGGKVIGLDMTPEMVEKAKANARAGNYTNVEFALAEIEKLPLPDDSVDVVISNCVINHSPNKVAVFSEAYRVLKPGGRIWLSDLVLAEGLPKDALRNSGKIWTEWLAIAADRGTYLSAIEAAGFQTIAVVAEALFPMAEADPVLKGKIISLQVRATKP